MSKRTGSFIPVESPLDYFPYPSILQQEFTRSEWHNIAKFHGLRSRDKVQFYVTIPRSQENHYLIEYVRTEESGEISSFPEFRREKLLFEREMTAHEVKYSRLIFSMLQEFVNEDKVEAGDVIKVCKTVRPFSPRHFFIMHGRKGDEAAETSATNDGGGNGDDVSIVEQNADVMARMQATSGQGGGGVGRGRRG
ncbi:hypothetical protein Acr_15g0004820 [Actinidia rufa]|uniref:Uncharacterized protein n=1 Tax=Actinidia rufa TaxID=165716 RepID=A0A7J0FT52_9ERIC|nr:hypothetical protein Acr_15g0004820 [Actinidia rufa]